MNLKKWGGGGTRLAQGAGHFFVVPLHFFCTISRFGERFCDAQYSLVSFLFAVLLLTVPPCSASEMTYIVSGGALNSLLTHTPHAQPFVKVGGTCPRALWSRRHRSSAANSGDKLFIFLFRTVHYTLKLLHILLPSKNVIDTVHLKGNLTQK